MEFKKKLSNPLIVVPCTIISDECCWIFLNNLVHIFQTISDESSNHQLAFSVIKLIAIYVLTNLTNLRFITENNCLIVHCPLFTDISFPGKNSNNYIFVFKQIKLYLNYC